MGRRGHQKKKIELAVEVMLATTPRRLALRVFAGRSLVDMVLSVHECTSSPGWMMEKEQMTLVCLFAGRKPRRGCCGRAHRVSS